MALKRPVTESQDDEDGDDHGSERAMRNATFACP